MPRFHPQLLASQNVRVRRSHKDIPAHLSRFRGKQPRSVEESCLHTTEPAWRGVQTKLQPETLGLLLLPPLSYSLAPFHQRSPRAGKLGPWAKSCQLQALVNKVYWNQPNSLVYALWLLSRSTSRVNSVRQRPQLSKPPVFTIGPSLLKLCYFR